MTSPAGTVASVLHMMPKMYADAIILFVCSYFAFQFMFYITAEWRKFKQERK